MNKINIERTKVILIIMLAIIMLVSIFLTTTLAYADEITMKDNNVDIDQLCNIFTASDNLYDPSTTLAYS